MRLLATLLLAFLPIVALAENAERFFGQRNIEAVNLGVAGDYVAMLRHRDQQRWIEVRRIEGLTVLQRIAVPTDVEVAFALLPQRRFAYVLPNVDRKGRADGQSLHIRDVPTGEDRVLLSADRIHLLNPLVADMFSLTVSVEKHSAKRGKSALVRIDLAKGKRQQFSELPGRCIFLLTLAGQPRFASCVDGAAPAYYWVPELKQWREWRELIAEMPDARPIGLATDTRLAILEARDQVGATTIVRAGPGQAPEMLARNLSVPPWAYLRTTDQESILGAFWLLGEPNTELFDLTHLEAAKYLTWSIKHQGKVIRTWGRTRDQRMSLVELISDRAPSEFQIVLRDQELPRELGRARIGVEALSDLRWRSQRIARREHGQLDAWIAEPASAARATVIVARPTTAPVSWVYDPLSHALVAAGYRVINFNASGKPEHQAADLADVVKWSTGIGHHDAGQACLVAESRVLQMAQARLFALASACAVALGEGGETTGLPAFPENADATRRLRDQLDSMQVKP